MWDLNEYKRVFIVIGLIGIILFMAPAIASLVGSLPSQPFSELYVLGPGARVENYPFNISISSAGASNSSYVYLGIGNHLGYVMYYGVDVKFLIDSDPLPSGTTESPLPVLYQYRVFLEDGQNWTDNNTLTFSFANVIFSRSRNNCSVGEMQINGASYELDKVTSWNNINSGFFYQLLVELWTYNQTINELSYDGRFISLWLNMTSTS